MCRASGGWLRCQRELPLSGHDDLVGSWFVEITVFPHATASVKLWARIGSFQQNPLSIIRNECYNSSVFTNGMNGTALLGFAGFFVDLSVLVCLNPFDDFLE